MQERCESWVRIGEESFEPRSICPDVSSMQDRKIIVFDEEPDRRVSISIAVNNEMQTHIADPAQ